MLLECLLPLTMMGQVMGKVSNIRFETNDNKVTLYYDLAASNNEEYTVAVLLRKESDRAFRYAPKDLQGDVGRGHFAGKSRKIVWNISKEFPEGLEGSDYYFEIIAEEVSSSGNLVFWIGAGAAIVGGAVAAVILLSSSNTTSPAAGGFPPPPGRPK